MAIWADRLLPRIIDRACGAAQVRPLREVACAGLTGTIIELGFGSGLNCALYPDAVTEVVAVEPSESAWRLSAPRRAHATPTITRGSLDGQRLPYDDASFDGALSTFTLCTIPDLRAALGELLRVLRPGGRLRFAEHGLAPDPGVARWQRRLDPVQGRIFGGCHLARDIAAELATAGFGVHLARCEYLEAPRLTRPWSYAYVGIATRPALTGSPSGT